MRVVITALALALLVIGASVCNSFYITRTVDDMIAELEKTPASHVGIEAFEHGDMNGFYTLWEKNSWVYAIGVNYSLLSVVEENASNMLNFGLSGDTAGYMAARSRLLQSLRRISELESLTFDGII